MARSGGSGMRNRTVKALFLPMLALAMPQPASAAADQALGAYLAGECTGCHIGRGPQPAGIPAISGWPEDQFVAVMEAYRSRQREHPLMRAIASRLGPEEIAALAAYYRSLGPQP
jgi:cytochrome c553